MRAVLMIGVLAVAVPDRPVPDRPEPAPKNERTKVIKIMMRFFI